MTPRERLYALLLNEIALGWPDPYWPQDRAGFASSSDLCLVDKEALDLYLGLLHEAVESIPWGEATRYTPRGRRQRAQKVAA